LSVARQVNQALTHETGLNNFLRPVSQSILRDYARTGRAGGGGETGSEEKSNGRSGNAQNQLKQKQ
jgi:hypothetical protein